MTESMIDAPARSRTRPLLAICVLLAGGVGLAGCDGLLRSRIYLPDRSAAAASQRFERAPQSITATTTDGLTLEGYYWPPAGGRRDLIVFFSGNAGNRDTAALMAEPLSRDARGLLVASYRGYGRNPGRPSKDGLARDADAFIAKAHALAPDAGLIFFGFSLGAAVALDAAHRQPSDMVVTLGAFTRLVDVAPAVVRGVLPDRYDNLQAIRGVRAPVLILHGTDDEVVPFSHAERLQQAAGSGARLVPLRGGGHHVDLAQIAPKLSEAFDQRPPPPPGPARGLPGGR